MTELIAARPQLGLTQLHLDIFDVRGAVIIGERAALVWDTLSHPRDMEPVRDLIGDKPTYVVYSHADWDHCWGTSALHPEIVFGHYVCGVRFSSGEVAAKLKEHQAAEPKIWDDIQLVPPTVLIERATIDLGGVQVALHSLAGHTRDCMVAFIPEWGILLAGDTVETPFPVIEEGGAVLDNWIDRLTEWAADERVQQVIPAHGEIGDRTIIERNLRYLTDIRAGKTPDVPAELDNFYTKTHMENLTYMP